ncbi:Hypothetical protein SCF082_LOCUS14924 [Durusdinium trenchii]|uniref:Uncharacterized protein n=1 Tax=Durusdinium trenchii TaxID=1381693 RepID=A0ABP0K2H1_9DINO
MPWSVWHWVLLFAPAEGLIREFYTTNAACRQQYCINPVYPGLQDLPRLEKKRWAKIGLLNVSKSMDFCNATIDYNVALPMSGKNTSKAFIQELVQKQEQEAVQTYFIHLSAMGIEPWDHFRPFEDSSFQLRSCARAVARMACYTYFPAAIHNVPDGAEVRYHRPCDTGCESYIQACGVECCDESTVCAWNAPPTAALPMFQAEVADGDDPSCCPDKKGPTDAVGDRSDRGAPSRGDRGMPKQVTAYVLEDSSSPNEKAGARAKAAKWSKAAKASGQPNSYMDLCAVDVGDIVQIFKSKIADQVQIPAMCQRLTLMDQDEGRVAQLRELSKEFVGKNLARLLEKVKRPDIQEIKAFMNPPRLCRACLQVVLYLMVGSPMLRERGIRLERKGTLPARTEWDQCVRMMANPDLFIAALQNWASDVFTGDVSHLGGTWAVPKDPARRITLGGLVRSKSPQRKAASSSHRVKNFWEAVVRGAVE